MDPCGASEAVKLLKMLPGMSTKEDASKVKLGAYRIHMVKRFTAEDCQSDLKPAEHSGRPQLIATKNSRCCPPASPF